MLLESINNIILLEVSPVYRHRRYDGGFPSLGVDIFKADVDGKLGRDLQDNFIRVRRQALAWIRKRVLAAFVDGGPADGGFAGIVQSNELNGDGLLLDVLALDRAQQPPLRCSGMDRYNKKAAHPGEHASQDLFHRFLPGRLRFVGILVREGSVPGDIGWNWK